MTDRDPPHPADDQSDSSAQLRRVLERLGQAEQLLADATRDLEALAAPVGPPHPPPPPPWREVLPRLEVVIEGCVATSLRARRDVLVLLQQIKRTPRG